MLGFLPPPTGAEKGRPGLGSVVVIRTYQERNVCCDLEASGEGAAGRDGGSRSPAPGGKWMNKLLRLQEQWKLRE